MLEPTEHEQNSAPFRKKEKTNKSMQQPACTAKKSAYPANKPTEILVRMSKEWIRKSIQLSVSYRLTDSVPASYGMHSFYAPLYHPTQSSKKQAEARLNGHDKKNAIHSKFHYADSEVKSFVNKQKNLLPYNTGHSVNSLRRSKDHE